VPVEELVAETRAAPPLELKKIEATL
jgi:hypothetical protein